MAGCGGPMVWGPPGQPISGPVGNADSASTPSSPPTPWAPPRAGLLSAQIARVCHEANRALQVLQGDPAVSPAWDDAPDWQCASAADGVVQALAGATPEQLHESWCEFKRADGWTYGPVKDAGARTHPCLVPYAELPAAQRLFAAIVAALSEA
jgi:hypothetical protein